MYELNNFVYRHFNVDLSSLITATGFDYDESLTPHKLKVEIMKYKHDKTLVIKPLQQALNNAAAAAPTSQYKFVNSKTGERFSGDKKAFAQKYGLSYDVAHRVVTGKTKVTRSGWRLEEDD